MPDETLIVLTEQAQEIGKLEAETEQQEELLEEIDEKVEDLERRGRDPGPCGRSNRGAMDGWLTLWRSVCQRGGSLARD